MGFYDEYKVALRRKKHGKKGSLRAWILKNPHISLICVILVFSFFIMALQMMLFPPPPIEPAAVMTIGGYFDWFTHLQMSAVMWSILLLYLWLTKW